MTMNGSMDGLVGFEILPSQRSQVSAYNAKGATNS